MKIFISQKMRNKTQKEIIKERNAILNGYLLHGNPDAKIKKEVDEFKNKLLNEETFTKSVIKRVEVGDIVIDLLQSYKPELAFKDPITSLSQSLAMLAEADIVLVPKAVIDHVVDMNAIHHVQSINDNDGCAYWTELSPDFIKQYIKGCEFEFLIALSYGKKVYTYDENYTFEEV